MIEANVREGARGRITVLGLLVAALVVAGLLLSAKPAHADTAFTVDLTDDSSDADTSDNNCKVNLTGAENQCTLRAAIEQANATTGADTINFNIPGSGVKTISPTSPLPDITEAVTIDGYTQPGASPNTKVIGNDAVLLIELTGEAGGGIGLKIQEASNSVIKGLVINSFGEGVQVINATGNRIEGNFVGTDPSGTQDLGNGGGVTIFSGGVTVPSTNNTVGGTTSAARNVLSGNGLEGVEIRGFAATGNQVSGNYIGTDASGTEDLGNGVGMRLDGPSNTLGGTTFGAGNLISGNDNFGVLISRENNKIEGNLIGTKADRVSALGNVSHGIFINGASGNAVGSSSSGAANVIAHNEDGIFVGGGQGNSILSNTIFSNVDLGINLRSLDENERGITSNDTGDADTGANNLQNYPEITSAKVAIVTKKKKKKRIFLSVVRGSLNSTPNQTFTIQLFSNPLESPEEGKTQIGQTNVTTDPSGNATFNLTTSQSAAPFGSAITATATDSSGNNTSEFSDPTTVS